VDSELQKKLLKKASQLLARRAYSKGELCRKLEKTVADETIVVSILDRLEQLKLLNDTEYAYNFALSRISRDGWGPAKVRHALIRRHVSLSDISIALDRIRTELGDEYALADYLRKYFNKRGLPKNPKSIRNLILHLQRRGYNRPSIWKTINHIVPSAMLHHFDTGD
jgi:regulatory protein